MVGTQKTMPAEVRKRLLMSAAPRSLARGLGVSLGLPETQRHPAESDLPLPICRTCWNLPAASGLLINLLLGKEKPLFVAFVHLQGVNIPAMSSS